MKRPLSHVHASKGFSLVELLVVVSIFVIITSIVLFNQGKFSSDISNSNVAYAIALEIREAQVYGILVRNSSSNDYATDFDSGYGIHFRKNGAGKIVFELFADDGADPGEENNLKYDPADHILRSHELDEGNIITSVCVGDNGENEQCITTPGAADGYGNALNEASIVFKRPDPAAIITDDYVEDFIRKNQYNQNGPWGLIDIYVWSALRDKSHKITVRGTGQISVYNNL